MNKFENLKNWESLEVWKIGKVWNIEKLREFGGWKIWEFEIALGPGLKHGSDLDSGNFEISNFPILFGDF